MQALIDSITALVTGSTGWVVSFVNLITGQPLLLLFVITGFVGLGVGLIKRILKI